LSVFNETVLLSVMLLDIIGVRDCGRIFFHCSWLFVPLGRGRDKLFIRNHGQKMFPKSLPLKIFCHR
jgi:hypothetical protein